MAAPAEDEVAIVRCGTSAGPIALKFDRKWSPHGYDRAVELFERGFYDNTHFFRVVKGFLVQFGITYSTSGALKNFANEPILDDPQLDPPIEFKEGTISYAGSGENSRTSQLFISYGGSFGKSPWETPVGEVVEGMENARNFYSYGDMPPWGKGPVQGKIHSGRSYIEDNFPLTDHFLKCTVEREDEPTEQVRAKERRTLKDHSKVHDPESVQRELGSVDLNQETGNMVVLPVLIIIGVVVIAAVTLGRKKKGTKSV